jgi:hypothetical protein
MLGIPVAAGVLYPFIGLLLSPIIAGAAMSLSCVSVISNALVCGKCGSDFICNKIQNSARVLGPASVLPGG